MNSYQVILTTFLNVFLVSNSFGQVTSEAIESENEQLISSLDEKEQVITDLNSKVAKLEGDIQYLKESLDLMNSKTSFESNDIIYKITSVVGKIDQKKIIVEGLVENHGAVRASCINAQSCCIDDSFSTWPTPRWPSPNANRRPLESYRTGLGVAGSTRVGMG